MPVYGTWQQGDDFESIDPYRLQGYNIEEDNVVAASGGNRPWDGDLNDGMGGFDLNPQGTIQTPFAGGIQANMHGQVHVFDPANGDTAVSDFVYYGGEVIGDAFAVVDIDLGYDLRGPLSIDPFDWPAGAVGYEWEDAAGFAQVVGARMTLKMTDYASNCHEDIDLEGLAPATVEIRVDGETGTRVLASFVAAAAGETHEYEFDLSADVDDEGHCQIYPTISKSAAWSLSDPLDNLTAQAFVQSGAVDVLDEQMFYTLRPPRHRFIYETSTPPRPWRLFPRDDRLSNNARISPAPATRQQRDRIFPADW